MPHGSCIPLQCLPVFWTRLPALCKICMIHYDSQHRLQTAVAIYNQHNMCNSCRHITDDVHIGPTVLKIWHRFAYWAIALCFCITIAALHPLRSLVTSVLSHFGPKDRSDLASSVFCSVTSVLTVIVLPSTSNAALHRFFTLLVLLLMALTVR